MVVVPPAAVVVVVVLMSGWQQGEAKFWLGQPVPVLPVQVGGMFCPLPQALEQEPPS